MGFWSRPDIKVLDRPGKVFWGGLSVAGDRKGDTKPKVAQVAPTEKVGVGVVL